MKVDVPEHMGQGTPPHVAPPMPEASQQSGLSFCFSVCCISTASVRPPLASDRFVGCPASRAQRTAPRKSAAPNRADYADTPNKPGPAARAYRWTSCDDVHSKTACWAQLVRHGCVGKALWKHTGRAEQTVPTRQHPVPITLCPARGTYVLRVLGSSKSVCGSMKTRLTGAYPYVCVCWGGGGWHDTSLYCCLQLAAPVALSPLTLALSLNSFPPQAAAPIRLSPPRALPLPAWAMLARAQCPPAAPLSRTHLSRINLV